MSDNFKHCCQEFGCGTFLDPEKDIFIKKFGSVIPCSQCGALYYKRDLSLQVKEGEKEDIRVFYKKGAIKRLNKKNQLIIL